MPKCIIQFEFKIEKFVNAVAYLASHSLPFLDKLKISKLLYFSDKIHLQNYGRPIVGDTYYALSYGPIPTVSLDIMDDCIENEVSYFGIENLNLKIFSEFIGVDTARKKHQYPVFYAKKQPDLKVFSSSEIEALNRVREIYGNFHGKDLINLVDKEITKKKTTLNSPIDFRLFLEDLENAEDKEAILAIMEEEQSVSELWG